MSDDQAKEKEKATVCYIGADKRFASLLENRLVKIGVPAVSAADAVSGIRMAQHYKPPVIVLDQRMGHHDSIAVAMTLRRILTAKQSSIIWHAFLATREAVIAAARAGINGILVRPLSMPTLIERINAILSPSEQISMEAETDPAAAPQAEDVRRRLAKLRALNAVPMVVERVLKITGDEASSARDLEQIIESDPQVTAVVLQRANSAYHGAIRKIGKVIDAVARIGFREVRSIVLGLSVMDMFPRDQKTLEFDRIEFWKSCLATAVIARELADAAKTCDADEAFIAGLLHDLGRIILDEYFTDEFTRALVHADHHGISLLEAERRVFGIDHQEVARDVLERWQFPPHLVAVVGCHEEPEKIAALKNPAHRASAETVWAAEWLTLVLGLGHSGERFIPYPEKDFFNGLKFWEAFDADFRDRVEEQVRELLSFVGATLTPSGRGVETALALDEDRSAVFYEDTVLPVSPLEQLLVDAHFSARRADEPEGLATAEPRALVVCQFESLDLFREAIAKFVKPGRPMLVLLPRGEMPKDDRVKEKAGFPVRNVAYLETPLPRDRFVAALMQLLPLLSPEAAEDPTVERSVAADPDRSILN